MLNYQLDRTFAALADPARRAMWERSLDRLGAFLDETKAENAK